MCVEEEKMKAISSASNTSTSTVYTSSLYIEPFLIDIRCVGIKFRQLRQIKASVFYY